MATILAAIAVVGVVLAVLINRGIRRYYQGPLVLTIGVSLVLAAGVLVALHFIYTWMGDTLLDPGGAVG